MGAVLEASAVPARPLLTGPSVRLWGDEERRTELAGLLAAHGLGPRDDEAPDVAVVVLASTERRELGAVRRVRTELPGAHIVVVATLSRAHDLRVVLGAGADSLVLAEDAPRALVPAIHAVLAGQACVPQDLRRLTQPPALSYREKEVLDLMASGAANRQIAETLFITESTVKSHLASAFFKLGVHSRAEAILALEGEAAAP
jgi:DNA-binding NarL/FixJ family response regulator